MATFSVELPNKKSKVNFMKEFMDKIKNDFINDYGKARFIHKILYVCYSILILSFGAFTFYRAFIEREAIAFLLGGLQLFLGLGFVYVWYYVGKSVLMLRDRMSLATKEVK
jgi:hypothetical protein